MRLQGIPAEELITPGNQVIDVLHHDGFLIGRRARTGDEMGFEGMRPPGFDGGFQVIQALQIFLFFRSWIGFLPQLIRSGQKR